MKIAFPIPGNVKCRWKSGFSLAAVVILCLLPCFSEGATEDTDWSRENYLYATNDLVYRYMIPKAYTSDVEWPLILSLHGLGRHGTDNIKQVVASSLPQFERFTFDHYRKNYPCFVVAPQLLGSDDKWETNALAQCKAIIQELSETYNIDMDRIYVMGHSMGGRGTFDFIRYDPTYFAAASPTAGFMSSTYAPHYAGTPLWAFYGLNDSYAMDGYHRDLFASMQATGGNMKYTEFPGVTHNATNKKSLDYHAIDNPLDAAMQMSDPDLCDPEPTRIAWLFKHPSRGYHPGVPVHSVTGLLGQALSFDTVAGVVDPDGDDVSLVHAVVEAGTGEVDVSGDSVNYTPGTAGSNTVLYLLSDEIGNLSIGTLTVHAEVTALDYDDWTSDNGLSGGDTTETADPDGDGVKNIVEYALGLSPDDSVVTVTDGTTQGLPMYRTTEEALTITFVKDVSRTNAVLMPQQSFDLDLWSNMVSGITETSLGGSLVRVDVDLDIVAASWDCVFMRLGIVY